MTFTIDMWLMLIDTPTFYILLQYLETILVDLNLVTGTLHNTQEVEYVRLGCGTFATELCEIK